jgi:DNA repair exonuclease SbcCD ATPase subunit
MLLITLLTAASAFSLPSTLDINSRNVKRTLSIIDSHKYGNFLLDVVALQVQTGGGIDTIIDLIDEIIADLKDEQATAEEQNSNNTELCDRQSEELRADIKDSQDKINEATYDLEENLRPHRDSLVKDLADLEERLEQNQENKEKAQTERETDHESFLQRAIDYSDAIASCDEALRLLSQLKNEPESASTLLESRAVSKAMETVSSRFKRMHAHSSFGPMIDALVDLSMSQNFANQETLAECIRLIEELRQELIDGQRDEQQWEDEAQSNHDSYISSLDNDYQTMSEEHSQVAIEIVETDEQIASRQDEIETETTARDSNQASLTELEAWCATEASNYQAGSVSRNDELEILAAVRVIFVDLNSDMEDYMRERVDADFAEAEAETE